MVVGDLPVAVVRTPHVGKTSCHGGARAGVAQLKGVHAGVQVRVAAVEHLHAVVGDGAEGVLEDEVREVVLRVGEGLDVLGRDGGQEGKLVHRVQVGHGLGVLGLEGIVPPLEVGLRTRTDGVNKFRPEKGAELEGLEHAGRTRRGHRARTSATTHSIALSPGQ